MWVELAAGGFLIGKEIYHRWIEDKPAKKTVSREVQIPRTDAGTVVPLVYGRTRVRAPILAWHGCVRAAEGTVGNASPDALRIYKMSMLLIVGIPFDGGDSESNVHGMWAGDTKMGFIPPFAEMPRAIDELGGAIEILHGGQIDIFDGNPNQDFDSSITAGEMATDLDNPLSSDEIPGYRGYISVGLHNGGSVRWQLGDQLNVPAYSFEASSYHNSVPALATYARVGDDSNPVNVIYDLLVAPQKLSVSPSLIDMTSFQSAQYVLHSESHGYSRSIEDAGDADEIISEILKQIDGCLRFNPTTGLIEIKLIRNDYDPTTVPHLTKENCEQIIGFAMGGWTNVNNALTVVYTNREDDYQEGSVREQNQANAAGQDMRNQLVLQYPGICTHELAEAIAKREIAARSRPIIKMRMICKRSMIRVSVGDAVKVTWKNPDISGAIFRVAAVERGTLENGKIALDLIQDYFYVWRNQTPLPPGDVTVPPPVGIGS